MIVSGFFEKIFTEDCNFGDPKIDGSRVVICVRNAGVISGHPLYNQAVSDAIQYFPNSHFIFEGVAASIRDVSEYEVNQRVNRFKPTRVIDDGPFPTVSTPKKPFRFVGILDSPKAWTDWTILAASFSLEVV